MSAARQEVQALLDKLPDDCSLEDVQHEQTSLEGAEPRDLPERRAHRA